METRRENGGRTKRERSSTIVITHFGGVWKVPVESIALVVLLVAVSCVLAVHGPAKRIRNMPITATINEL